MDKEVVDLIAQIAKEGSTTAVWIFFGIQIIKLISSSFGYIFWMWLVKVLANIITNIIKFCIEKDVRALDKIINK